MAGRAIKSCVDRGNPSGSVVTRSNGRTPVWLAAPDTESPGSLDIRECSSSYSLL